MDSILITGASGFLGSRIAELLLQRGYHLRLQYRRSEPPANLVRLEAAGAELIRLDLTSPEAPKKVVDGMDGVVHTAALIADWGPRELFDKVNAQLPRQLVQEAGAAGCRRFLFVSSIAVHGFGAHRGTTEEGPYYKLVSSYQKAKLLAERYILASPDPDLQTTIIRPGNIYGPGDINVFYPIFDAMTKGMMGYTGNGERLTCPVFVDDVAEAVLAAYESEKSDGEVFNITSGEVVTWRELLEYTASLLRVKPPRLHVPVQPARILAVLMEFLYFVLRIKTAPLLTRYRIDTVSNDYHFDIQKAQNLLGYKPKTDWREGFRKTVEAYLKTRRPG